MPVVSSLSSPEQGEELAFTCTSTNGYPKPNVYWINKTDNSLLDTALQNSTISLNERGLYDVVSILRIRRIPNVNVGCCIENVLLHQNLTVSSQTGKVTCVCMPPNPGRWAVVAGKPYQAGDQAPLGNSAVGISFSGWQGEKGTARQQVHCGCQGQDWGWLLEAHCLM